MCNKHILILKRGHFGERSKESLGCEAQAGTFRTQAALPLFPLFCAWSHAVQAATIYPTHSKGAFRHLTNCATYATNKCLWLWSTMNYDFWFELYIWEENQPVDWKPHRLQRSVVIKLLFDTIHCTILTHRMHQPTLSAILTLFDLLKKIECLEFHGMNAQIHACSRHTRSRQKIFF